MSELEEAFKELRDANAKYSIEVLQLKKQLAEAVEVIEFYGDVKGENWGACRGDDTHETCCHMISEISGGDKARQFLAKYRGENG